MFKSLKQTLVSSLSSEGFLLEEDNICRLWNHERTICCALGLKRLNGGKFATLEIGFVSPQILQWIGIPHSARPLPYYGNGFGIYFRLEEMGIRDGYIFPPGGWRISKAADKSFFGELISHFLPSRLKSQLVQFMRWDGWVGYFREQIDKSRNGRGLAWSMLGYSMLMNPNATIKEIQLLIDEHSLQDASEKIGNRIDIHINRQKKILNERMSIKPTAG